MVHLAYFIAVFDFCWQREDEMKKLGLSEGSGGSKECFVLSNFMGYG